MSASSTSGSGAGRPSAPRTLWVRGALLGGVLLAVVQAGPTIVDLRLGPLIVVVAGAAALALALQGLASFLGD